MGYFLFLGNNNVGIHKVDFVYYFDFFLSFGLLMKLLCLIFEANTFLSLWLLFAGCIIIFGSDRCQGLQTLYEMTYWTKFDVFKEQNELKLN